jgi:hypothetical protein
MHPGFGAWDESQRASRSSNAPIAREIVVAGGRSEPLSALLRLLFHSFSLVFQALPDISPTDPDGYDHKQKEHTRHSFSRSNSRQDVRTVEGMIAGEPVESAWRFWPSGVKHPLALSPSGAPPPDRHD